jgi:hypothetical protein
MPTDTKRIADLREPERTKLDTNGRHLLALEQIADALEGIRIELNELSITMNRPERSSR